METVQPKDCYDELVCQRPVTRLLDIFVTVSYQYEAIWRSVVSCRSGGFEKRNLSRKQTIGINGQNKPISDNLCF